MSERKVLNKYYPPDFDPSKLPRVKREKNRQFTIRLMAPFNMRCTTCGEYIYRGKKFNARKEDVIGKMYLGIQIYRFYIKCTKCLAEITFMTDPENSDYHMENGAIRNFECIRLAEKQAELEAKQEKEEEENNPMKILENRTRDSRREMAVLETLEDLRELNATNASVDLKVLLEAEEEFKNRTVKLQEEEDEAEIRRIFGKKSGTVNDVEEEDEYESESENENETESPIKSENISTNDKKHKIEEEEINVNNKKAKTEVSTEIGTENKTSGPGLFKKPNSVTNHLSSQNSVSQKSKISSFIKKKPDPVPTTPAPSLNPLAGLADYSSDENSD